MYELHSVYFYNSPFICICSASGFLNYVDLSIFFSSEESTLVLRLHSTE